MVFWSLFFTRIVSHVFSHSGSVFISWLKSFVNVKNRERDYIPFERDCMPLGVSKKLDYFGGQSIIVSRSFNSYFCFFNQLVRNTIICRSNEGI